jgi:hypothetical protein
MQRITILPADWIVLPWAVLLLVLAITLKGSLPPV